MDDEKYNGWTNYETWLVYLWMDNEKGSQDFHNDHARQIYADTHAVDGFSQAELAKMRFADWLKDWHEENRPEMPTCGLYYDLLSGALSAVNWDEIARHYIDAVLEEVK